MVFLSYFVHTMNWQGQLKESVIYFVFFFNLTFQLTALRLQDQHTAVRLQDKIL